jgi:hypothetical protein
MRAFFIRILQHEISALDCAESTGHMKIIDCTFLSTVTSSLDFTGIRFLPYAAQFCINFILVPQRATA